MPSKIKKILIAENRKVVAEALRYALNREKGLNVVAIASDGREAVRLALKYRPDLILMDVMMPLMNGIEATRQIKTQRPRIKIIGLTGYCYKDSIVNMLDAGASGFLLKDGEYREIIDAINCVVAGGLYLSPAIGEPMMRELILGEEGPASSSKHNLTERELEVLDLIAGGHSTKEIGGILDISVHTVATHRRRTMKKLGVKNKAHLVKSAIKNGLIRR